MFSSFGSILLLAFGFGFVIFFHELGHFLAAKWADVRVEQFAVGFGQAMISWRKGLGMAWGSTATAVEAALKTEKELHAADTERESDDQILRRLGISETEYRLNWIPLGGYVKMLGQDDLKPGATVNDPRAYNNKTIGQRMVIVSAGVIMNVILAAIGFMAIFLIGFEAPETLVGSIQPGSPAQQTYRLNNGVKEAAPLEVGDRILYLNDKWQSDFTKIQLNVALMSEGPVPVYVKRLNGKDDHLMIVPEKPGGDNKDFALIGITPAFELRGFDAEPDPELLKLASKDAALLKKGDSITAVAGKPLKPNEFWKLDRALQQSQGAPVEITITDEKKRERTAALTPYFVERFAAEPVNFAGMLMRTKVHAVREDSPAKDILKPGDVILAVSDPSPSGDLISHPTSSELRAFLNQAGQRNLKLDVTVLRDGSEVALKNVSPSMRLSRDQYGIGIGLGYDDKNPVIAGTLKDSPASAANIPDGATITAIDGKLVKSWFDVNAMLCAKAPGAAMAITALVGNEEKTFNIASVAKETIEQAQQNRFSVDLALRPASFKRKTPNPFVAAAWGFGETRDAILNVYQTVRAMVNQRVSYKQVSGPVGIFHAGYKFAVMGIPRLIWFLSIISANLAVMNFLPIPIVDGGLFAFLIIEKIKGGPVSPRVQAIAQVVGLAILLSVFLLATYQDITRLPFMM